MSEVPGCCDGGRGSNFYEVRHGHILARARVRSFEYDLRFKVTVYHHTTVVFVWSSVWQAQQLLDANK
jgi:hypothetical protein